LSERYLNSKISSKASSPSEDSKFVKEDKDTIASAVNLTEFLGTLDIHLTRHKRRVIDIFDSFDRDEDGMLSPNDLAVACNKVNKLPQSNTGVS
jgi:Ca2+-binding EF-hand superfamily protein